MPTPVNDTAGPAPAGHREVGGGARHTIHRFASHGPGSVNSFWVETPNAVVVFDAQRQLSQARLALAELRRLSKPIAAIIVSHEHPDHVGGLPVFADAAGPGTPILASAETRANIAADGAGFLRLARTVLGDDFPASPTLPTGTFAHGDTLEFDGLAFRVHEFGPCEARSMTALRVGDGGELLAADIAANGMTPFLLEGHVLRWIDQLERFPADLAGALAHPGHGGSAGAGDLVGAQLAYLRFFRDLVADAQVGGAVSERVSAAVVQAVMAAYPGLPPVAEIPGLLTLSVGALARELAAEAAPA